MTPLPLHPPARTPVPVLHLPLPLLVPLKLLPPQLVCALQVPELVVLQPLQEVVQVARAGGAVIAVAATKEAVAVDIAVQLAQVLRLWTGVCVNAKKPWKALGKHDNAAPCTPVDWGGNGAGSARGLPVVGHAKPPVLMHVRWCRLQLAARCTPSSRHRYSTTGTRTEQRPVMGMRAARGTRTRCTRTEVHP